MTENEIKIKVNALWNRGGQAKANGNPWHQNLNDAMFWL